MSLVATDPAEALSACEESLALTGSGASDVMFTITRGTAAIASAVLGDRAGALELIRDAIRYSAAQGDRTSVNFALSAAMLPLIGTVRPELAVSISWALEGFLSTNETTLEVGRLARQRAVAALGPSRSAELRVEIELLSFEETVDVVLAELDQEIAAAGGASGL